MRCKENDKIHCNVEKRGCLGCGYADPLDDLHNLVQDIGVTPPKDVYLQNVENQINDYINQIDELKIQRDYYKKMYIESQDFMNGGKK